MATDYTKGDYRVVAKRLLPASEALVDWCSPGPGDVVVDVAAGSGNLARLCRDRGARVVATDRAHSQLLLGADDGEGIDWVAGDAHALPLRNGIGTHAFSVFGLIYAEQPATAVAEMARVCRPGATLGLTAWQADGYQQQLARLLRESLSMTVTHDFLVVWGTADAIAEQLAPVADDVEVREADLVDRFGSVEDWWRAREYSAPIANARAQLDEQAYEELGRRMRALAVEYGEHDGGLALRDRYLLARGRVR